MIIFIQSLTNKNLRLFDWLIKTNCHSESLNQNHRRRFMKDNKISMIFFYLFIELTLGTFSASHIPSAIRRSRISQANIVGV